MSDEETQDTPPETPDSPASPAAPAEPVTGDIPEDAKSMAMLAHLLGITMIGSLIIWLIKKDDHPFIDQEGKEAVNFQITALIGYVISGALAFICVGMITGTVVWVCVLIFCIMGGMKAKEGEAYRYPVNIRFIK